MSVAACPRFFSVTASAAALDDAHVRLAQAQRDVAEMDALRTAADEVYAEKSASDEMFRRVIDSYRAYAENYREYQTLTDLD